jgi:nicotinic acid mononucleotide adenylyltransferase
MLKLAQITGVFLMSTPVHDLTAEVLELPAGERAKMLELLIASFEPQSDAQRAWASVALQRRADVRGGKVAMVDGAQAVKRVRARIA